MAGADTSCCSAGKHTFHIGTFRCGHCQHAQVPHAIDLQRAGIWPATPDLEHVQTYIDERTLQQWHRLKLTMPTTSLEGFAEVLNTQTDAWGNSQARTASKQPQTWPPLPHFKNT